MLSYHRITPFSDSEGRGGSISLINIYWSAGENPGEKKGSNNWPMDGGEFKYFVWTGYIYWRLVDPVSGVFWFLIRCDFDIGLSRILSSKTIKPWNFYVEFLTRWNFLNTFVPERIRTATGSLTQDVVKNIVSLLYLTHFFHR